MFYAHPKFVPRITQVQTCRAKDWKSFTLIPLVFKSLISYVKPHFIIEHLAEKGKKLACFLQLNRSRCIMLKLLYFQQAGKRESNTDEKRALEQELHTDYSRKYNIDDG